MERVSEARKTISPKYFVEDPRCGRAFWLSVLACFMSVVLAVMFAVHVDPVAAKSTADILKTFSPAARNSP